MKSLARRMFEAAVYAAAVAAVTVVDALDRR